MNTCRIALVAAAVAAFAGHPADAQTPPSPLPAATRAPAQSGGPRVELSMTRAVEMALEANLGLQADRMSVDTASHAIAIARAAFLPQLATSFARSSSRSVPQDFTQGADDITSEGMFFASSFVHTLPMLGSRYDISWNNNRNSQIGGNPLFNPFLRSSFALNFTQPLLRGLRTDPSRAALDVSERRRTIADIQLEQQIVRTRSAVENAYLDLISATQALRVAEQNMEVRQASLADARARVAVGASAPIDLISAEADVASNQEQVLLAEAQIATREDVLRTMILDPARADYWTVQLVPTDTIRPVPRAIDLEAAITNALDQRLDLAATRRELEIDDLTLRLGRDSSLPAVDLRASYATNGTGGTRLVYGEGFPPPIESRSEKPFGSVLSDTFGAAYPQWTLGINVSYPIGRSAAEASYAQSQVQRRQRQLALRELEIVVVQQVRDAARQVESSYQRVLVTGAALRASEQQLEAEQRRFTAGLSTTLELQVRQGQLAAARTSELNAVIAYNRALIDFERVQRTQ